MTQMTFKLREEGRRKAEAKLALQRQMIDDYGDHLQRRDRRRTLYRDTAELPHPKDDIIDALLTEISYTNVKDSIPVLAAAAMTLANYHPGIAGEALETPDPAALEAVINDRVALGNLMRSFDPARIKELGDISSKETEEIMRWIGNAKRANPNLQPFYVRWWRSITR